MLESIRVRLTLWYVAALAILLIIFSVAVYVVVDHSLKQRVDEALRSTLEVVTTSLRHGAGGIPVSELASRTLAELQSPNQAVAVLDANGRVVAERPAAGNVHVRLPPSGVGDAGAVRFYSLEEQYEDSDDACRVVMERVRLEGKQDSYVIVVNQSSEPVSDQLDLLQDIFLAVVPLILALAAWGGWLLARRSLAPVVQMSDQARRISAGNLEQRLPIANARDELGRLATTFNDLLARLNEAFARQRQFTADASHELRTPLSIMQTAAQVTLDSSHREEEEYREALTLVEQQVRHLSRIVEDMLVLANAGEAHPQLQASALCLNELIQTTANQAAVLARQKDIHVSVAHHLPAPCTGDERLLQQMFLNLLDNAIKYAPQGGKVALDLEIRDATYRITVSDNGPGIPAADQPHVFERFFRSDKARSRGEGQEPGSGLGLPIARWIAEAHHGRLELQCSDEHGSTFVVFLPRT